MAVRSCSVGRALSGLGGFCLFLFSLVASYGQAGAAHQDELAFTVFAVGESPAWDKLYYLTGPKDAVKLAFSGNRRSAPLSVKSAQKPLVFGVEHIDPETKETTYVPLATVAWPQGAARVLCVFMVAGGSSPRLEVIASDDGPKAFPVRSVRVFNALDRPLAGKVVAHTGELPPGFSAAFAYPVDSVDPNKVGSFPMAFAAKDATGELKLLYSGYGESWAAGRSLVFVQPAPKIGPDAVQVRTLVDVPPAPRTKSAP